jgi:hypothetical protein
MRIGWELYRKKALAGGSLDWPAAGDDGKDDRLKFRPPA